MRLIVWITFIAAALYGGYWFIGSRSVLAGTEEALQQMQAEGRGAYQSVSIAGFPSRFDMTVDRPALTSADGAVSWSAPFLQVLALSYRPNHVIAVWPNDQTLQLGAERFGVHSSDMKASVALTAGLDLPLDHAEFEAHDLGLTLNQQPQLHMGKLLVASRQKDGPQSHEVAIIATDLAPGDALRALIDPAGKNPALFDQSRLDMIVDLDRPLDRGIIDQPARITALRQIDGALHWGTVGVTVAGDLTVDAQGIPAGNLRLVVTDLPALMEMVQRAGLLSDEQAAFLRKAFDGMATTGTDGSETTLPLTLLDGQIWFGLIPLGPAPQL